MRISKGSVTYTAGRLRRRSGSVMVSPYDRVKIGQNKQTSRGLQRISDIISFCFAGK